MTNAYDYSEYDVKNMIYSFSDLSPEQAEEKRKVYEEAQLLKAKAKAEKQAQSEQASTHEAKLPSAPKPFKPVIKAPSITKTVKPELENENKIDSPNNEDSEANPDQTEILNKEIKNTGAEDGVIKATNTKTESTLPSKPKPVFKPVIKPIIKKDIPPQSEDKND
jgi:NADH-quinone oxidoreductase subunit I